MTNGVKQGCVLASTLFSMMFSAMLSDPFQDGDNGIPIRYRFDGKRLNHSHTSCLRKLLKIKWQDRIPDTEVLKRAGGAQYTYSSEIGTVKMDRPCYQNA